MVTEAGNGDHHVYLIRPRDPSDQIKLTPGSHYVGVDAVAWFINKKSSWFTDRMASGTLDIRLSNGLEKYQTALGTFELKGGARVAPVFERAVLPDRNYVGGVITLAASLISLKKNTVLGGLLKSAASASLGIVAGMVQTATVNGPAKLLMAAGEDLISGVKRVLAEDAEEREPLFDFSGLEYNVAADLIVGPEVFVLFHRGDELKEEDLSIRPRGQLLLPFLRDSVLEDGAWLLLRLRRSSEYSGVREWYAEARELRAKIDALVQDVATDVVTKQDALKRLRPGNAGDTTVYDDFIRLRTIISRDGVLSELQAKLYVGNLNAVLAAARKAITEHSAQPYHESSKEIRRSLLQGQPIPGAIGKAFTDGAVSVELMRRGASPKKKARATLSVSNKDLFEQISSLPNAVKLITRVRQ
ncbi:MAG: hypothetical protein AB1664_18575 [Thermodesulfobacteriota bacterium]